MLGDVAGHADERAILHTSFLAASTPVALLMMAPALYLYSTPTAAFQQVPALDVAIQTGKSRLQAVCSYPLVKHCTSPSQQVLNRVKHEPAGRIQTGCDRCFVHAQDSQNILVATGQALYPAVICMPIDHI